MSHLEVAAKSGMKAGFKAYMGTLQRSRLPQVIETRQALDAMTNRQAFAWYCAKHGPDVTAIQTVLVEQAAPTTRKRTSRPVAQAPVGLAAEIAEARARLAELEAQASKPAAPKAKSTTVKENLWREWAVRKHNIPTKVGATFTYKGKRRTTTFVVTRVTSDGVFTKRA